MEGRDFLKSILAGGVHKPLPKRPFRDGVELSIIGLGGIVVCGLEQKDADTLVAHIIERGVNYFDVAPSYFDGEAEIKLGNALSPYRHNAFLACKTTERDAKGARAELEQSLERLHTDHFDLYQFHEVTRPEDVERILAPGGAGEAFLQAREEGKVRYLGCSAHTEEAALAMLDRFPLDSILFPLNFVSFTQANFGPRVFARAREKGIARLALKSLAYSPYGGEHDPARTAHPKTWYKPIEDHELASKALRFTLSEDITAAIPPGEERIFTMALDLASDFAPLSSEERAALLARAGGIRSLFPVS